VNLSLYLLCPFLLIQAADAADSPEAAFARIRSRITVAPLTGSRSAIAGKYTSTPKELGDSFLSGEDLHLFPDGTYIYCEWSDVMPMTVLDKGTWRVSDPTVELTSDPDITWKPRWGCCSPLERRFLLVQRVGHKRDALLMGMSYGLSGFEEDSKDDPGLRLLNSGLLRTAIYDRGKAIRVRARLMNEAWRPDTFTTIH
jgi:hypothetical protein